MAKIAMFLARSPAAPMTGRKAVLNTAIAALAAEGHEVDLFILAAKPDPVPELGRKTVWLGAVPKARLLWNAAWSIFNGARSLNEALFHSPGALDLARGLGRAYDFAVADTIRAAPYADALGVPWHLDLDDLFSARYEKYLEQHDQLSADLVLGYYRASVPRAAAALPKPLLKRLLKREAALLRRREVYWARRATTVSLVSPDEASSFARIASRPVHSLPMQVGVPARRWRPGRATSPHAAFLGGLDYKPNLDALLYYQESVFPVLSARAGRTTTLDHIGNSPADLRKKFLPEAVSFQGYVTDVVPRLSEAAFFVAPIVSGTGIKTKVLEAMAIGLPVLSTAHGVAGLQVEHKKHCFICERPDEFAEGMRYLGDPQAAGRIGSNARQYVEANFSSHVLRQRWAGVIRELQG